jgi:hypothetical protein
VWRALGEQVGQHDQPVAARGHRRGELEQLRLGVLAEVRGERFARPLQDDAAVVDRPADNPAPGGQRVAEHPAEGVDGRTLDDDPDGSARADRAGRDSGAHGARAEVGERPVGAAGDDRGSRVEAKLASGRGGQPRHVRARHEPRELVGTPAISSTSAAHSSDERRISPVAEADEWSMTQSPVSWPGRGP